MFIVVKIIGYYLNEWKQSIKLEVNGVTIDTGYTDYDKLDAGMKHIFDSITGFINEDKLRMMDSRQYMLDLWEGKSEMTARLDGLDDEQTNELQAKILEEKGYIVIKQEDSPEEEEEEEDGLDVITIETEEDDDDEKFEDI